jgi:hypothetical protein
LLALSVLSGCTGGGGSGGADTTPMTREELLNPEKCKDCHPKHYEQWSSSMHAYASKDPVFRAMNKRGQREAQLGKFCVNCHAPMAVREGKTQDGLNLDQVPDQLQGVTCYFCHNAVSPGGDHNNMVVLANDTTMRAGVKDPVNPKVHVAAYSELHDRDKLQSSTLCGGCHDIVTPNHGVHLERTFEEYRGTFFADPQSPSPDTCQGCHMDGYETGAIANVMGVKGGRQIHDHFWAGVDVPLTDFPHSEGYKAAVEECALRNSIQFFDFIPDTNGLPGNYQIILETSAGHNQPSGASQDRRMWLDIIGYDRKGNEIKEFGKLADGEVEPGPNSDAPQLNDRIFDAQGNEVHMFWEADKSAMYPDGYQSRSMPRPVSIALGSHSLSIPVQFGDGAFPSRVEVKLLVRPMGADVLQDLVGSGDLDAGLLAEVPTFTVYSATVTWDKDNFTPQPTSITRNPDNNPDCDRFRCLVDSKSTACNSN